MKLCQPHWNELRQAIHDRGLNGFVSPDSAEAMRRTVQQVNGDKSRDSHDPLMAANFAIWSNAMKVFGIAIMAEDATCPLCVLDRHARECTNPDCPSKETGTDWIRHAADAQLEYAVEQNWILKH